MHRLSHWLFCLLIFPFAQAQADTVRIVAASDLQFALADIADTFRATHPEIRLELSFGSSGKFYTQLVQGLPADLYFSADDLFPEMLEEAGLTVPGTRALYAVGRIVIWVSNRLVTAGLDPRVLGAETFLDPRVTELAIANPVHAPYGRAAVTFLENAGFIRPTQEGAWEGMTAGLQAFYDLSSLSAGKPSFSFVYGENISLAAQYALTSTDIGIIALSLALSETMEAEGVYWLAPLESHLLLNQTYVILQGQDRPAVRLFYDYVGSPEGQAILERYGFILPAETLD